MAQYPQQILSTQHQQLNVDFPRSFPGIQRPSVAGPQFSAVFDEKINNKRLPRLSIDSEKRINVLPPFLSLLLTSNYCLVILCIGLTVPVLELVIGFLYKDKCPAEPYIPKYLIVTGICGIIVITLTIMIVVSFVCCIKQDSISGSFCSGCMIVIMVIIILLLSIFLFAWFIAGNVWIFGAKDVVDFDDTRSLNYCSPVLYEFAFWIIIVTYVMVVVCCCFSCFRACYGSITKLRA